MADFGDDFAPISQDTQFQEEDPAAAFLAREQTELAGLEDYTFGGDTTAQDVQGDYDPFGGQADDFDRRASPQTNGPSDAYSAISQADRLLNEPEKIRIWREEQKKMLEKKDQEEEKKKTEWMHIAKKEIEDWYKHHEEQLVKTKENNRASEEAFVKDRDKTEPGEEWEKICRLCEFNPKNSKNTKDVSRLRSILLQLKQTPLVR
ncbi:hypothetical protein CHS0354_025708 [Potamilus streckersoni]|uniref:Clathrin light chain n=1 Tax=Potamilus streckersoni TaxID=2493646 RepID=A0AAE0S164_9BIVA|nr:hypothetical protein CHS0354_025708 [Potamilus streckersoni]